MNADTERIIFDEIKVFLNGENENCRIKPVTDYFHYLMDNGRIALQSMLGVYFESLPTGEREGFLDRLNYVCEYELNGIAYAIGNRIKNDRKKQGLTLELLAEKTGISKNTLSAIEQGKTNPSLVTLQNICDALYRTIVFI